MCENKCLTNERLHPQPWDDAFRHWPRPMFPSSSGSNPDLHGDAVFEVDWAVQIQWVQKAQQFQTICDEDNLLEETRVLPSNLQETLRSQICGGHCEASCLLGAMHGGHCPNPLSLPACFQSMHANSLAPNKSQSLTGRKEPARPESQNCTMNAGNNANSALSQ